MKKILIRKDTLFFISLIFIEFIAIKIFQFNFLPAKYFYDSNKILDMILYGTRYNDLAYDFSAQIFSKINILNLDSLEKWAYFIGTIFTCILFILLLKRKEYSKWQYLFIYTSIALLNIYVFNLSKDIIQFAIFLIIYLVLLLKKIDSFKKMILIAGIILAESFLFRIYYAIMAMNIVTMWIIYKTIIEKKRLNKRVFIKLVIIALIAFFTEIFIVSMINNDNYQRILYARYGVNSLRTNDMDVNTIINDPLGENTNYFKFVLNYIINLIRLMIPLELLLKGMKYIPFVIYQIAIIWLLVKSCKKANEKNALTIIVILSFIIISIIFEPDFGSFIRHESSLFLLFLDLTFIINKKKEKNEVNVIQEHNTFYDKIE